MNALCSAEFQQAAEKGEFVPRKGEASATLQPRRTVALNLSLLKLVARTSSMNARQCALNFLAAIFFTTPS